MNPTLFETQLGESNFYKQLETIGARPRITEYELSFILPTIESAGNAVHELNKNFRIAGLSSPTKARNWSKAHYAQGVVRDDSEERFNVVTIRTSQPNNQSLVTKYLNALQKTLDQKPDWLETTNKSPEPIPEFAQVGGDLSHHLNTISHEDWQRKLLAKEIADEIINRGDPKSR